MDKGVFSCCRYSLPGVPWHGDAYSIYVCEHKRYTYMVRVTSVIHFMVPLRISDNSNTGNVSDILIFAAFRTFEALQTFQTFQTVQTCQKFQTIETIQQIQTIQPVETLHISDG